MASDKGFETPSTPVRPSVVGELLLENLVRGQRLRVAEAAGDAAYVHDLEIASAHTQARLDEECTRFLASQGFGEPATN